MILIQVILISVWQLRSTIYKVIKSNTRGIIFIINISLCLLIIIAKVFLTAFITLQILWFFLLFNEQIILLLVSLLINWTWLQFIFTYLLSVIGIKWACWALKSVWPKRIACRRQMLRSPCTSVLDFRWQLLWFSWNSITLNHFILEHFLRYFELIS